MTSQEKIVCFCSGRKKVMFSCWKEKNNLIGKKNHTPPPPVLNGPPLMYIIPSMGLNASCFFGAQKNTCQSYHPAYHSPASFSHTHWHRHRKRWASVTDVVSAKNRHWFNAQCLLCSFSPWAKVQNFTYRYHSRWPNLIVFYDLLYRLSPVYVLI